MQSCVRPVDAAYLAAGPNAIRGPGPNHLHALGSALTQASSSATAARYLKNRILLENYFFPADLEAQIETFVDHYNHRRYHESINNLTPADVYFGRGQAILKQRERIKRKTMETRRLKYRKYAA